MIRVHDGGGIRTATISAEQRRNALTRQMVADLVAAVDGLVTDPGLRAMVITGAGTVAFSAGGDIKEMAEQRDGQPFVPVMPELYERALRCPKPLVAALNGDAVGGGLELALCCDVIVARREARVGLPEAGIGAVARYGAALLARQIGAQPTLALALLSDLRTVEEVPGVAARIVDAADVLPTAAALAERLAILPPASVAATKEIIRRSPELPLAELVQLPSVLAAIQSDDRLAAVRSFAGTQGSPR